MFLVLVLTFFLNNGGPILPQKGPGKDVIYIKHSKINKEENSFYFILIYENMGKKNEVYRKLNKDYTQEFKYKFWFKDTSHNYKCFNIYDLPTGLVWSILFEMRSKAFFITEPYDGRALGDFIKKESVSFDKLEAEIESHDEEGLHTYKVKLNKIWPK